VSTIGSREEWLAARVALLAAEKEFTRRGGLSAFALEGGAVYHTYSCYDRGTDVLSATWQLLDRTPKGRGGDPVGWPCRHDE
jgi:predicted dithiol-disulfide oxidoreductase (DUF899 family)